MYETKTPRIEHKVAGEPTRWVRAPSGARYGVTDEAGNGSGHLLPGPAAPSWDDRPPDPAALEKARQAGRAYQAEGYGGVLPGMAPCMTCPPCQAGLPAHCRRPLSLVEARNRAGQAKADRLDQADADVLDIQRTLYREQTRRGIAL